MTDKQGTPTELLRALTLQDFLVFGIQQVAYIRPVIMNGSPAFAIHAADGTPLAFHENQDTAKALTRQNDLEPMTVH